MARGRKSQYINKLTSKDKNMLRAFRNVGYLREDHLKDKLGMSGRRIQNFIRDGHIERVSVFDKHTKAVSVVYRLTEKGQEFTRQQMNLYNFYRSSSVQHDLALSQRYFQATTEQQHGWLTEKDWKDRFEQYVEQLREQQQYDQADELEKMREQNLISFADGGYVTEETVVAIEIVTSNYGQAEIEAKTEFAQVMNAEYQSYKI